MKIYMTEGNKRNGREYCHTCNEDITIIKGHDCKDGWAYGTVIPMKIQQENKKS